MKTDKHIDPSHKSFKLYHNGKLEDIPRDDIFIFPDDKDIWLEHITKAIKEGLEPRYGKRLIHERLSVGS